MAFMMRMPMRILKPGIRTRIDFLMMHLHLWYEIEENLPI
jgi:hypothetical protein